MRKILATILATIMLLGLSACGGTRNQSGENQSPSDTGTGVTEFTEPVVLKWAIAGNSGSGPTVSNDRAMKMITERSNGMITFDYYTGGVLGNGPSLLSQVLDGTLDICGCGIAEVDAYTDTLDILDLPFLVGDNEKTVLFSNEWKALVDQASEELGGNIVATYGFGSRDFVTCNKPVYTMADLKGMNIRTVSTQMIVDATKLLGANPVNVAFNELYTALSSGMVDGIEQNITTMNAMGLLDTVKYCTRINFYPYVCFNIVNPSLKESLPEGYYELIVECMEESAKWWADEGCAAWEQESLDAAMDANIEIIEIEEAALQEIRDAVAPLYDEYAAKSDICADFIAFCQSL